MIGEGCVDWWIGCDVESCVYWWKDRLWCCGLMVGESCVDWWRDREGG